MGKSDKTGREASFATKQNAVQRAAIVGGVSIMASLALVNYTKPSFLQPKFQLTDLETRISMIRWIVPVIAYLLFRVGVVAFYRTEHKDAIDGSAYQGSVPEEMRIISAILQNTLEQTVIACVGYLIWLLMMPMDYLCLLPVFVLAFLMGRILFARGYPYGPPGRALGFALTFLSSTIMILLEAVWMVSSFAM